MTAVDVATIEPLGHDEAMALQATELDRAVALLSSLDEAAWSAQTDCPEWDVRRMYLHVLGACEGSARMREGAHQLRAALAHRKRHGGPLEAALSDVQVREREHLAPAQVVSSLRDIAPKAIRGRRRIPALVRDHARIAVDGPVHEKWALGYLAGTIYLRDLWMHRVDAARATGRPLELTADHDGRIVADVVAEWARRHGRPFLLDLDGPAGGSYVQAPDAAADREHITCDAVELCRTLAGRTSADGLLATVVPF